MFNGPDFPEPLDEEVFVQWIEKGKESKVGYQYLLIVWDAFDAKYNPVYAVQREELNQYEKYKSARGHESLVAVYDLYSESRIA